MSKDQLPELVEKDVETLPSIELNQSKFDALIQFSQQTEKLGKALDRIRAFLLGRALPGDFVQHGDTIGPTGPATERMLSALGLMGVPVTFSRWDSNKTTGADKAGDWYDWEYSADVEIGGLRLGRIEAHAGSRDKFFGYAHGNYKDLSEVKEADVRMAARRGVFKEAIRVSLGLRGIPADQAGALGLDIKKIKKVEYGSGGNTSAASTPAAAAGTPLFVKSVNTRNIKKKDGSTTTVYVITDENGTAYETFSESIAKAAKGYMESKQKAIFDHEPNGKFAPKLKSMSEANDSQPDAEPVG